MKVVKELYGGSGSKILLIENPDLRVRKEGNVHRNLERYTIFETLGLDTPRILKIENDAYEMQYIPGLEIKTYLTRYPVKALTDFILQTIDKLLINSKIKDYSSTFDEKLNKINFTDLHFSKNELISKLPKHLPQSHYHGDLTLDNIIFDTQSKKFVLIDPLTSEYDSYVFDIGKLRQDITCRWFLRNSDLSLHHKLMQINANLAHLPYVKDDSILILMLLRILPYQNNTEARQFIINEVNKLWKS